MSLFETEFFWNGDVPALPSLMSLLEGAADIHARKLGWSIEKLHSQQQSWVLVRYFGETFRQLKPGEGIRCSTFPSKADKYVTCRDFILEDATEQIIAHFRTEWLILDLETRRPVKLPSNIQDFIYKPAQPEPVQLFEELQQNAATTTLQHQVSAADLDINNHVNNRRYVHLLTSGLSAFEPHLPRYFDIHFKAEAFEGDQLQIVQKSDGGMFQAEMRNSLNKTVTTLQAVFVN